MLLAECVHYYYKCFSSVKYLHPHTKGGREDMWFSEQKLEKMFLNYKISNIYVKANDRILWNSDLHEWIF